MDGMLCLFCSAALPIRIIFQCACNLILHSGKIYIILFMWKMLSKILDLYPDT